MEVSVDEVNKDQEALQAISDAGAPVPVTMTLASGITYAGVLAIEGELSGSKGTGKISFGMRGQRFEQI